MANTLKPKRSATAAKVPTTTDLASGELGVNMADRKIYIHNGSAIVQVGAGLLSSLGDVDMSGIATGNTISWDGTKFVASATSYLPLSGGTLTGNLRIDAKLALGATPGAGDRIVIGGTSTGASSVVGYGINASAASDVTTSYRGFSTFIGTAAAAFTLADMKHYQAGQGTIGAGSTITTQTGFDALSTLVGGTTNYGFRGQIPTGSGRWNLYMDGTADNYIAGNTGIGGAAAANAKLRVVGSGSSSEVARIEGGTLDAIQIINQTDDPSVNTARAQLSLRKNNVIGATISVDGASANRGIVYYDAYSATGSHAFYVNSTDRFRINSVGAVSFSGSYGTANQILTSGSSTGTPSWQGLKTINGNSILGSGDIVISGGAGGATTDEIIALTLALG